MSKKAERPQTARHIVIFDEDWELINKMFGPQSASKIGASAAIRNFLHRTCEQLRAREESLVEELRAKRAAGGAGAP